MHDLIDSLADLVLARQCAGCDAPGRLVCADCRSALQPTPRLRKDLDLDDVQAGLRIPVACSLDYRGPVRHILYRYKDHRIRQLADAISPALACAVEFAAQAAGVPVERTLLVPMPSRRPTVRKRGFDATGYLARRTIRLTKTTGLTHLIADTRSPGSSKQLAALERHHNVIDAFAMRRSGSLPSDPVILLDDVITTGATAREATATLILAGVHVAAVATAAGTP